MVAVTVDWTQVLILGVPAYIAALGGAGAAIIGALNRRSLQTPSGESIGRVAERAHDLAAVSVAAATGTNGDAVTKALEKLNADPKAPVDIDPAVLDTPKE